MTRLKTGLIAGTIAIAGGLLLAAPMLAAAYGFGHGRCGGPGPGAFFMMRGPMLDHLADELDLTDEQYDQIDDIFDRAHDEVRAHRGEMREAREQGMALLMADTYDADAVQAFAQEQSVKVADMIVLGAKTIHEAKAVLTPEQRAKLQEIQAEHMRRHDRWHDGPDDGA